MPVLRIGSSGSDVKALQDALRSRGFSPGITDGIFGPATQAAVLGFQRSERLLADGIVGPRTAFALALVKEPIIPSVLGGVSVEVVSEMFPGAPVSNIERYLPTVLAALIEPKLTEKTMVLMSLATIRAESAGFLPIDEGLHRFNTSPQGHPFDLYDYRVDLGNSGPPDGARYRGRGFVQLTGQANYRRHGEAIGVPDLVARPERANDSQIAARLLASFIKARERRIKEALLVDDLAGARRLVNGGNHGLESFCEAYRTGCRLIPETLDVVA